MKQELKLLVFLSSVLVGVSTFAYSSVTEENFESIETDHLPKTWESAATNAETTTAVWKVIEVKDPSRGKKVLSLTAFTEGYGGSFNLCYSDRISFKDGEISVWFKSNSGKIDQGGGIMWRVQDKDTYYVTRFNPLEDNFRFYSVIKGDRKQLCSADVHLKKGWHFMKIVQKDNYVEGFIDGKKLLSCYDDAIKKSGGVGVWTKADAATSFDDFTVKSNK